MKRRTRSLPRALGLLLASILVFWLGARALAQVSGIGPPKAQKKQTLGSHEALRRDAPPPVIAGGNGPVQHSKEAAPRP